MSSKARLVASCVALSTLSTPGAFAQQARSARPEATGTNSPDARAAKTVAQMTEDEKFAWISGQMAIPVATPTIPKGALGSAAYYPGIPRLGIPAQQQSDASLGVGNASDVRPGDNATALPSSLLLGAAFDPDGAEETGALVGYEARAKGFTVQLAGGANLIREPRGGRNFEYVSEDPLLTGVIAGHSVAGIQSQGVVATVKHFALNAQETGRVLVSSDLAEGPMYESDLLAFKIAIEIGQPGSVMPGYNLINGHWASENAYLINTVLKGEWRYPGWVMSDWGATHSTVKAALAGLDVQSGRDLDPTPYFAAPLRAAVAEGKVPQTRIDDMVRRQLRSLYAIGVIDNPPVPGAPIDYMAHRLIAQRAAERGLVLLKNEPGTLPLAKGAKHILVIGQHADTGVLAGGGSSAVTPVGSLKMEGAKFMGMSMEKVYHPSSPLVAIKAEANAAKVDFLDGTDRDAAIAAARKADVVIVLAEEWRAEGQDMQGLNLPDGQDALIDSVATANPRTIVVVESGGPVAMPWLSKVPAVIAAFYPGSGGGEAIAGVLFGRVNPSGRLPVTFPASVAQLPHPEQRDPATTTSNPGEKPKGGVFHVNYDVEGSDVGYRWYAKRGLTPLFPFGHGLSYTTFATSDLSIREEGGTVAARFTITNTGARAGADVPQLYVTKPGADGFVTRLAGFKRVELAPGESMQVELKVDPRLLARFDATKRRWQVEAGRYVVRLASDAIDTGLTSNVDLTAQTFEP